MGIAFAIRDMSYISTGVRRALALRVPAASNAPAEGRWLHVGQSEPQELGAI